MGGQVIDFVCSDGLCTGVIDEFNRKITYEYITDNGTSHVAKVIESNPADPSNSLDNRHGRLTWLKWEGGKVTQVAIGMPKSVNAEPGASASADPVEAHYYWRRTQIIYDANGQLTHLIPPEQYDAWADSSEPDRDDKYATMKFEYYAAGQDYSGKVKKESAGGCGCGGGVSLGVEYAYPSPNAGGTQLYDGTAPTGANRIVYQLNTYRWEGGQEQLAGVTQYNTNRQVAFEIERATDTTGWLKQYSYNSDYQLDNVAEYSVTFNWASPANASNRTQIAGRKYSYDGTTKLRTQEQVWDGSSYITVTGWGYNHSTRMLDNETSYVDSSTTLVTHYFYDDNGMLSCVVHPQVLSTQNSYDGQNYNVSYYAGDRTFYDTRGRIVEGRQVKLSNTPSNWNNSGTDCAVLARTNYYYIDNATTGCFELSRTVVDENGLNLVRQYSYAPVCGIWRTTAEIVDPLNPSNPSEKHLNLVTSYDYTAINPEDGAWGSPTAITEPESAYVTTFDYDKADRVLSRTRTCNGQIISKTVYHYCKYGKKCSTTQAAGLPEESSSVTEWDDVGRTSRVYTGVQNLAWQNGSWTGTVRGNISEYAYIAGTGRVALIKRKAGWANCAPTVVASYTYTVDGKQKIVTDAVNCQTQYAYNKSGFLDNVTDALNCVAKLTYDRQSRQLVTLRYDNNNALMAKSESRYDSFGRIYQAIVYNPDCTTYKVTTDIYNDPLGRQVKVTDPNGHATEYAFDKAGRNASVKDALGNMSYMTYDPAGRVVVSEQKMTSNLTTPRRELTIAYYDRNGRTTAMAFYGTNTPNGWTWTTEPVGWDYSRILASAGVSDDNHLVTGYSYGGDSTYGSYVCVTDAKGIQRFTYADRLGRTTRTVESKDGIDRTTLFAYDQPVEGKGYSQDTITAKNEPSLDQVTRYVRGDSQDAGRVTETVYPDGGKVSLAYNADGTVKNRTDQRGWKTTFTYDAVGRSTQEDVTAMGDIALVGTKEVTRSYDALGRMSQILDYYDPNADCNVKISYAYQWASNSANLTVTETLAIDNAAIGHGVTTVVENGTLRQSLTYPNTRQLTFAYDDIDRLDTITEGGALVHYDYKGLYLQQRDVNGSALRLTFRDSADLDGYDAFGRVKWMKHYPPGGGPPEGQVKLAYGYDYASNPIYREDQVNTASDDLYSYDALHRLKGFKRGDLTSGKDSINNQTRCQNWTLDKMGNWSNLDANGTADVRQHNVVNEITLPCNGHGYPRTYGGDPREVTWDAAGNLVTCQTEDGTKTYGYTYDYRNRLIMVESRTTGSYSTAAAYLYDGLNRRVKKHLETGTDVVYIYDGWRVIEEREWYGWPNFYWKPRRQYVYGDRYIDERLILDWNNLGVGDNNCDKKRFLYAEDANWNVAMVTDYAGIYAAKMTYDPYGAVTVYDRGQGWGYAVSGNPYFFQGQRYDNETGLYYFKNRYYSPTLGRFMQRDPMGYVDGGNLYEALSGNSANGLDPNGLLVVYAEGAVRAKKAKGLERLSNDADKKFAKHAEDTGQQYYFARHREWGWFGGGWSDLQLIQSNADQVFKAILNTRDDTISIFAHSTGAATVISALEKLREENKIRAKKCEKPVRVDVLIIYAGTATRRADLRDLFAEVVNETIIIHGGKDTLVNEAERRGNADRLGQGNIRNLGQKPILYLEDLGESYFWFECQGVREDKTTWRISEKSEDEWGHITPFEKDDQGNQPGIDKMIERMK